MFLHVWALRYDRPLTKDERARLIRVLPAQRRARLERGESGDQALYAYALLRFALRETYGWDTIPPTAAVNGKPYFPDFPQVHFSISHTRGAVLVALSDKPVGADIETLRRPPQRLSRRLFPDGEPDAETFFTRWVRGEARAKRVGGSALSILKGETPTAGEYLHDLAPFAGSCACVCSAQEDAPCVTVCEPEAVFPDALDISDANRIISTVFSPNRTRRQTNMTYSMEVAGLRRELPICKVSDTLYIGAFICFGDAELTVACARELLKLVPQEDYDYLFTAEAKSIPLIHEMARQSGAKKYFIARKGAKVYMPDPLCVEDQSITTAGTQKLYLGRDDAELIRGKRILIMDDVISTGGSLLAMEALVRAAGGTVAGRIAVLAEGDAAKRDDIRFLAPLPLFNADGTVKG